MNPDIKAKWLAALRSGEYKQGTRQMRSGVGEETKYCCLGVLQDLYAKEKNVDWPLGHSEPNGCSAQKSATLLLPTEIVEWAGITKDKEKYFALSGTSSELSLAERNDGVRHLRGGTDPVQSSFLEIADIIEAQI